MRKIFYLLAIQIIIFLVAEAQNNIGIGTITPNAKSLLDLTANDKGFLVPRVSTAQRLAINPAGNTDAALLVYDTNDNLFYFWNSSQWVPFPQPGSNNISLIFDTNSGTLSLTDAGGTLTTNIPPDNDNDPTNEIQQLSLNGNILNLSISNSTIDLSPYLDNTDNQTLTLNNNTLAVSNGNSVDLSPYVNTDNQTLTLNGQVLSISNGNSVTLVDNINDADSNPTNELQTISATSASNTTDITFTLTPAGNTTAVNDGDWQFNGTNIYNLNSGGVRVGTTSYFNQCGGTVLNESATVKFAVMSGFSSFGNYNNDPIVNAAAPPTTWAGGVGSLTIGMNRLAGTSNVDFWNSSDPNNGAAALTINDRGFNWRNFRNNAGACAEQLLMTLSGAGNLTIAGTNYLTSDVRLKNNIENMNINALDKVMQLVPKTYYKVNATLEQGNHVFNYDKEYAIEDFGFIAQEVYEVFPELVYKPKDETKELWAVDYARLSVFLTKAIQQQQQTIETLQQNNKQLYSETEQLKKITAELSNRLNAIEKFYSVVK